MKQGQSLEIMNKPEKYTSRLMSKKGKNMEENMKQKGSHY